MVNGNAVRPLIAKRREARAREILDAALAIVDADGLEALTLPRLGASLQVAPAALYRYFDSKDAILARLQEEAIAALDAAVEAAVMSEQRPLARLLAIATAYGRLATEQPTQYRLVARLLADPRVIFGEREGGRLLDAARPLLGRVTLAFEVAARAKALAPGDPMERAVLYWAGLQGVLQLGKLDVRAPGLFASDARLPAMARTLLRGWGARERDLT